MKLINAGVFNLPLPNECVYAIMDYAFIQMSHYKKKIIAKINKIIKDGFNRKRVVKHFYKIWNDSDHDSYWKHAYLDKKRIVIQNENCVRCGNYREATCSSIVCCCKEFIEVYDDL